MKVEEIMTRKVITLKPIHSVMNALRIFAETRISGAPVVVGDYVAGMFTKSDAEKHIRRMLPQIDHCHCMPTPYNILEALTKGEIQKEDIRAAVMTFVNKSVGELMTRDVITVSPDDTIEKVAEMMAYYRINRLPVVDKKGKLVGIVTRNDVIHAMANRYYRVYS